MANASPLSHIHKCPHVWISDRQSPGCLMWDATPTLNIGLVTTGPCSSVIIQIFELLINST
jgi:hypothetical protein